jgi:hypothetical protein
VIVHSDAESWRAVSADLSAGDAADAEGEGAPGGVGVGRDDPPADLVGARLRAVEVDAQAGAVGAGRAAVGAAAGRSEDGDAAGDWRDGLTEEDADLGRWGRQEDAAGAGLGAGEGAGGGWAAVGWWVGADDLGVGLGVGWKEGGQEEGEEER